MFLPSDLKGVFAKMKGGIGLRRKISTFCRKENRIHIRVEFTRKKCKTAISLYCFHTAGILYMFDITFLGPGTLFYRKSKIIVKRKPNYEIGWFRN